MQGPERGLGDCVVHGHAARPVVLAGERVVGWYGRPGDAVLVAELLEGRSILGHSQIASAVHAERGAEDGNLHDAGPGHRADGHDDDGQNDREQLAKHAGLLLLGPAGATYPAGQLASAWHRLAPG